MIERRILWRTTIFFKTGRANTFHAIKPKEKMNSAACFAIVHYMHSEKAAEETAAIQQAVSKTAQTVCCRISGKTIPMFAQN